MLHRFKAWWTSFRYRQVALEAVVALCLAFLVWLYTHGRARDVTDFVQVPVQIHLAPHQRDHYAVESQGSTRVAVSFTGPGPRIRELRRKIQRGAVQANIAFAVPDEKQGENTFGDVVRVSVADVYVPSGVTAELADDTPAIPITVHRLSERLLPVRLEYTGDVRVAPVKFEPATVLVRGPKAILDRATSVQTQPVSLHTDPSTAGTDSVVHDQAELVAELEGRPVQINPKVVTYRCKVAPKQRVYELTDVPVHFLCPQDFAFRPRFLSDRPGKVSVRVVGPAGEEPPPVRAFVDLTVGNFSRGRNLEPVRLQLPKDFQLVQNTTPLVAFHLDEAERTIPTSQKGAGQ